MKFWEALKEMEAGAVCVPAEIANGDRHRIINGRLEVWDRGDRDWINSPAIVNGCIGDWRIVTPAPVSEECQPLVDFHTVTHSADAKPVTEKPTPGAHRRITKLQKRVKELERRADNMREWSTMHGEGIAVLEARLAKLEAGVKDAVERGVHECAKQIMRAEAQLRYDREQIEWAKAQDKPSEPTSIWPKGSLQWAEVEAKRMGLNNVRRKSESGSRRNLWIVNWSAHEDRHALDWEPCE